MAATAPAALPVASSPTSASGRHALPLAVLTTLFFMWGFITCLNDVIIPHFKAVFDLSYTRAMLVQLAFFMAYGLVSLPAGAFVGRWGYKTGIVVGLMIAAVGCTLFYPAAALRSYEFFLGALFVLASGITLLQVAANPYVAILGPPQTASARLTMTQAFNSLATTVAGPFGSWAILSGEVKSAAEIASMTPAAAEAYRAAEAQSVQTPYIGLALTLVGLAVVMGLFRLPRIAGTESQTKPVGSAWRYRHLVLGAVGIFTYVGAEVAIGSFLINYMAEPSIAGFSEEVGSRYIGYYWGGAMVGRFLGIIVLRTYKPNRVLTVHAVAAAMLVLFSMLTQGQLAMWSILAVGLFNSIMFPTIFTLAVDKLGPHTSQGSGILCTAIVGGALVPVAQGMFADQMGIHLSFVVPLVCYAFIIWYGLKGHRPSEAPNF